MSYALVEDVPASWEHYREIAESIRRSPVGLLVHVAGPTDEGFRIIEIWESEAAWLRFSGETEPAPALTDPIVRPRIVVRDLLAIDVVLGPSLLVRLAGGTDHTGIQE